MSKTKAKYEGWAESGDGKHEESAYFTYYSKRLGKKVVMCFRKMKDTNKYKPYAIISSKTFDHDIKTRGIKKGIPQ